MKKSIENSSASIKSQSIRCKSQLKWECSFKCCWLWWGAEPWHLLGHLLSFTHLLCSVWNVLPDTANLSILFLKSQGFLLTSGQCASKRIRAAFESKRRVVTRLKAFCLPLLTGSKQTTVVLAFILVVSLPWELLANTYLKREMQEPLVSSHESRGTCRWLRQQKLKRCCPALTGEGWVDNHSSIATKMA